MLSLSSYSFQLVLTADDDSAIWPWLEALIGPQAADGVAIVFNIVIYGIVAYIIFIQLIRLLTNFNNRNAEDQKARQEARDNIKASALIIVAVAFIGGFGWTALSFFVFNSESLGLQN